MPRKSSSSSRSSIQTKPKLTPHTNTPQIRSFLTGQIFSTVPPVTASQLTSQNLSNLTVIVTGANSGLGFEACKQLVSLGCVGRLILACRSIEKGEAAKGTLEGVGKGKAGLKIEVWQLDMADLKSVRAFAERCERELERIDSVVLNAGVDMKTYQVSSEENGSYEMTIMVNVVGTFVLAVLLVGVLREKARWSGNTGNNAGRMVPSRISVVGSAVQFFAKHEPLLEGAQSQDGILKWLSDDERWDGQDRYYLSKGIVQILIRQLARRIIEGEKKGKGMVVLNCPAPGYCRTELFREAETMMSRMALKIVGRDADVGARSLVVGALGEKGGIESHGEYMSEGVSKDCNSWYRTEQGEDIGKVMWDEVQKIVNSVKPGVVDAI